METYTEVVPGSFHRSNEFFFYGRHGRFYRSTFRGDGGSLESMYFCGSPHYCVKAFVKATSAEVHGSSMEIGEASMEVWTVASTEASMEAFTASMETSTASMETSACFLGSKIHFHASDGSFRESIGSLGFRGSSRSFRLVPRSKPIIHETNHNRNQIPQNLGFLSPGSEVIHSVGK